MSDYRSYLSDLDGSQKEAIFRAHLARLLLVHNFKVARVEPDVSEDIWISNRKRGVIYPAQAKGCFGMWLLKGGKILRYNTTIKAANMDASFGRDFYYFLGLYEPNSVPIDFRVGCIPSSFFEGHFEFLMKKRYQRQTRRLNIEIDHYVDEGRFFMFRQPIEVTAYFNNLDAIL